MIKYKILCGTNLYNDKEYQRLKETAESEEKEEDSNAFLEFAFGH